MINWTCLIMIWSVKYQRTLLINFSFKVATMKKSPKPKRSFQVFPSMRRFLNPGQVVHFTDESRFTLRTGDRRAKVCWAACNIIYHGRFGGGPVMEGRTDLCWLEDGILAAIRYRGETLRDQTLRGAVGSDNMYEDMPPDTLRRLIGNMPKPCQISIQACGGCVSL